MKLSHIPYIAIALLATSALGSCDTDGDLIYTTGGVATELQGTSGDIVLDVDHLDALALTLFWNDNGDISTNYADVLAPEGANSNIIQIASDEAFTTLVEETVDAGVYERQYTARDLNNITSRIGLPAGVASPIYVRVKSSIGNNIDPKYSNVLRLNVTPYMIDWTVGTIVAVDGISEGCTTLYSPNADGVYAGFVGAAAWAHWYLREGDYTLWGNIGADGMTFVMDNTDTIWNLWYPGNNGCYYTVANTAIREWSALLLPTLTIGGDIAGEMTYRRMANQWTYSFNATATTVNLTLSTTGKLYNASTSTDDAAAIDTPVAFGGAADNLSFSTTGAGSTISLNLPATGDVTLVLDLNDPTHWTLSAQAGAAEEPTAPNPLVYLVGIDDGITGSWTFDNYLRLYSEDNVAYAGVANTNSLWGYQIAIEKDNWGDVYKMTSGDGAAGTLALGEGDNIAAPGVGLYYYDVSLTALTYWTQEVTTVYYSGFNDDWALTPMTPTANVGEYTATITATKETPWGFEIVLDDAWNVQLGGADGILVKKTNDNIAFSETSGTFLLTVNLCEGTYSIVAQ